jgi:hypothetical protein
MQATGGHQELDSGHLGHLLAGEDQRNRLRLGRQLLEDSQGTRWGRLGEDLVVGAEAAAEVAAERLQHRLVLVHHQQNRQSHLHSPTAVPIANPKPLPLLCSVFATPASVLESLDDASSVVRPLRIWSRVVLDLHQLDWRTVDV